MPTPFTPGQLDSLSLDIDIQLRELQSSDFPYGDFKSDEEPEDLPERAPEQWQVIAKVSKEDPQAFWQRFKQAAYSDLCEEGGVLNKQWLTYRDLSSRAVLESFGAILAAMGFAGNALEILAVALAVIVMHLGCTAICMEA
ncbi:MAG: hypothetical protein SD837_12160 [Candidatus Electrothrix scaldis]|nr:MAG: hypothetical protein SD837_12160 [Candidatus Electrothrix sp. GW3-3]